MFLKLGPYHRAAERRRQRLVTAEVMGLAVVGGLLIGALAAVSSNGGFAEVGSFVREVAIANRWMRRNTPMPGAHYHSRHDAHEAGATPSYRSDHGYRTEMDGTITGTLYLFANSLNRRANALSIVSPNFLAPWEARCAPAAAA